MKIIIALLFVIFLTSCDCIYSNHSFITGVIKLHNNDYFLQVHPGETSSFEVKLRGNNVDYIPFINIPVMCIYKSSTIINHSLSCLSISVIPRDMLRGIKINYFDLQKLSNK